MKIVELVIDEMDELNGIEAISVVESPAIEEDFVALKTQQEIKLAELDKEKKILLGPVLIQINLYIEETRKKNTIYIFLGILYVKHLKTFY